MSTANSPNQPDTRQADSGNRWLFGPDITIDDVGLDDPTIVTHQCVATGRVHLTGWCPHQCHPDCNHTEPMPEQTTPVSHIDGRLCRCLTNSRRFTNIFGHPYKQVNRILRHLNELHDTINRRPNINGDLTAFEQHIIHCHQTLQSTEETIHDEFDRDDTFGHFTRPRLKTLRHTIRQLQQQLPNNPKQHQRRVLPPVVTPARGNTNLTSQQNDQLIADLRLLHQLPHVHGRPAQTLHDIRQLWCQQATQPDYQPQTAVRHIAVHLTIPTTNTDNNTAAGTPPEPQAARADTANSTLAAAQQFVRRWDNLVEQLHNQHAGRPRLINLKTDPVRVTAEPAEQTAANTILARMPPPPHDRQWTLHIIDHTEYLALRQIVAPRTLTDCGDATHLTRQAAEQHVDLNLLLQTLNQQHNTGRPNKTGPELNIEAHATLAALS